MAYENPALELNPFEQQVASKAGGEVAYWWLLAPEEHGELLKGDLDFLAEIALAALEGTIQARPRNREAALQYAVHFANWKIDIIEATNELIELKGI